jgi:2-phospho-L-lactate guanylyltransferase
MQATVASYDEDSRAGTIVTDQGETLGFTGTALAEHIRHLRPGQRVHVDRADSLGAESSADVDVITGIRIWR